MDTSVSLYTLMLGLIGGLAVLALVVRMGTQRHAALGWLVAALAVGAANTWLFANGGAGSTTRSLLYIGDPLALFCVAQSIRLALGVGRAPLLVPLAMTGLSGLSLALLLVEAPIAVEAIPAMSAGLIAYADALRAIWRAGRGFIRDGLLVSMSVMVITDIVRFPFFPTLLDGGRAYPGLGPTWLPEFLLITTSFAVPAVVLFIIAAIVTRVIGTYRDRSERDVLTDLYNRRAFTDAVRNVRPSVGVLVVADIDHFKSINDTFGHGVGDEVISRFAAMMREYSPLAARLGGEEFAIALPGASLSEGEAIAERMRSSFAAFSHPAIDDERPLSASFGIAPYSARQSLAESLDRADRALYRAKRQGRNCVAIFGTDQRERGDGTLVHG
ncbi:GGDEF domain-containing protein [Sphingomicrobium clamense]|uniref:diguanylate cyclase n=1 Tax=Sphingomicrobium clamense TaxID=2851013 RepID=A0ABS6V847_9SPHN|nr:GGDEF domain-containing protein [Sphingomicrobium sp. B8]MBW0145661.1 GGDEF domain-containing protein [Sphingomicrobium sp. B8]